MTALNIVIKIALFGVFLSLLYLVIDYFVGIIQANLNLPFIDLLSYLGVVQALQVLISISIASYVANQVIAYFRSA
jgi:phage-related holin